MAISFETDGHITDDEAMALVEKRVSAAVRQRIDRHLDDCEDCRELVAAVAMAGSLDSEVPEISLLEGSSELDSLITPFAGLDDSMPTQIYASHPPSSEGTPLETGDLVGHFRIMRALGRGAMGEVYLARDTMLGRKVALKVIAADLLGSERAMRRFLFEAKATAQFNHPNIVTIHAVGEHGDRPYVALEYVEGENLRERTKGERLPLPETLRIGLAIAEALAEAHDHGILHRDLKPANIIIGSDGRVRLLDFGLAKAVQAIDDEDPSASSTSSSTWLVGTPRYMSPEQWRGGTVEGTADVFALGVILYELCSGGVRPFDANNTVDLLRIVTSDEAATKLSAVADVPARLSELVARCLQKKADDRPSAKEVAHELRALRSPERTAPSVSEGPFRGLLPFTERHAATFFGRDAEIAALLERLRIHPVLPVLGPSGAGKTSLIQAGVIPRLREAGWAVLQMRPGTRPFETLASRFERRDSGVFDFQPLVNESGRTRSLQEVEARAEILRAAPRRLSVMLRELADLEDAKVLLFVDQLEEAFTMLGQADQKRFIEAVCTAADDVEEPVRVILALRHDFVDRLSSTAAVTSFIVLKTPEPDSLRQILEEPARGAGFHFEDDRLVDQMVAAVQGEPACLPLLQFAASQLWERRDQENKLLLRSAYEAMGGVGGALAQHADSMLESLSNDQRRIARTLLLRLVTPERTRRIVPKHSALDGLGEQAETVLDHLTEARLVSTSKLRRGAGVMLELAHQSLIVTWTTLSDWLEHSEDELRILSEATQAAELWEKRGRRASELWSSDAVRDADRALERATTEIPDLVRRFLDASRDHARDRARRRKIGLAGSLAAIAVIAVIGVVAFVWISKSRRDAEIARQQAINLEQQAREQQARLLIQGARKALEEGFPLEARAQVRRALELMDSTAARSLWHKLSNNPIVMRRRLGIVNYDVATSPDEKTIAVASHEGRIYLVNAVTGVFRHLDGHEDAVAAVAFTHDGNGLVAGDLEGNLIYWELRTSSSRSLRRLGKGSVWSVAVSPDDRFVAAAGDAGVSMIDIGTGSVRHKLSAEPGRAVVFADAGKVVAVGGAAGDVRFYDARSGKHLRSHALGAPVEALAAHGTRIAVARADGMIELIETSGEGAAEPMRHSAPLRSVSFHPDGQLLAAAGADGSAIVYDVASMTSVAHHEGGGRLLGAAFFGNRLALVGDGELVVVRADKRERSHERSHRGVVNDVRIAPDGKSLASAGSDGTVRLWKMETGRVTHVLRGHGDKVWDVAFAPSGELIASAGNDGTVRLWNAESGVPQRVLGGHENAVTSVSFNADGTTLASGGRDYTVRLWDVEGGIQERVLTGHERAVTEVTFSPKGDVLASSSADTSVRLWPKLGIESVLIGHEGTVSTVAFDPDGERLVSASADKTVRLWSLAPGQGQPTTIDESAGRAQQVAFHPDGDTVAVARSNGIASLIELATGEVSQLAGHDSGVNAIRFDRTGAFAATVGDDGTVRVWDMSTRTPHWRGVALVPDPVRVFTHRGWENLQDGEPTTEGGGWMKRIDEGARHAARAVGGGPVCLLTQDGTFESWSGTTRLFHQRAEIEDVVALPTACAARSVGAVHLVSQAGDHRELAIGGAPLAIGWGEQRLLVATKDEVLAFSESGERIGQHAHDVGSIAALTQVGSQLILGHPKRNITLLGTSPDEPPSVARFERASQAAPTRMTPGPNNTLVAGYRDGTVALFDTFDGALLLKAELHGPIAHLVMHDDRAYVVTELGDTLVWELDFLTSDYCALMHGIWANTPIVWEQGEPRIREAPAAHPCR